MIHDGPLSNLAMDEHHRMVIWGRPPERKLKSIRDMTIMEILDLFEGEITIIDQDPEDEAR